MVWAFSITGISSVLFVMFGWLFSYEQRNGQRMLLVKSRAVIDRSLTQVVVRIQHDVAYVSRYIITLSWYYSLHHFLMVVLHLLAKIYFSIEKLLHHNRKKAKQIRNERRQSQGGNNFLLQLTEHQAETALTEVEKNKRKTQALEGK